MLSGNADAQEEDFLPRVHYLLMTAELEKRFVHMPRGLVKQILSSHSRLQDNLETAHSAISDLQCELHYRDQEATEAKKAMTAMKAIRTTAIKAMPAKLGKRRRLLRRADKAKKAMKAMKAMKARNAKAALVTFRLADRPDGRPNLEDAEQKILAWYAKRSADAVNKAKKASKAMKAMKAMKFMKPMKGKKAMKPMKATTAK